MVEYFFAIVCALSFYSPNPIEAEGTVYYMGFLDFRIAL